jgi:hypothetical protein
MAPLFPTGGNSSPYGSPSFESEGQHTPLGEDNPHQGVVPAINSEDQTKGFIFNPQLTVNIYNTGGPNAGAPGVPDNGTGGNVTVSNDDTKGGEDQVSKLAAQVASLLQKVGQMDRELKELRTIRAQPMPVIETGTWSTSQIRHWSQPQVETEAYIAFEKHFESAPTVMVSMRSADVCNGANFRVRTYATDVTAKGFMVHADTWASSQLYSCDVSWIGLCRPLYSQLFTIKLRLILRRHCCSPPR